MLSKGILSPIYPLFILFRVILNLKKYMIFNKQTRTDTDINISMLLPSYHKNGNCNIMQISDTWEQNDSNNES